MQSTRGDSHIARAAAAGLSRRLTLATLRDLSAVPGLSRPQSVSHLTRRMERQLACDPRMKRDLAQIESRLARKTKHKVLAPNVNNCQLSIVEFAGVMAVLFSAAVGVVPTATKDLCRYFLWGRS